MYIKKNKLSHSWQKETTETSKGNQQNQKNNKTKSWCFEKIKIFIKL